MYRAPFFVLTKHGFHTNLNAYEPLVMLYQACRIRNKKDLIPDLLVGRRYKKGQATVANLY